MNGWHILPAGETATTSALITDPVQREKYFDDSLRQARAVVLSLHGNAGNRGTRDRVAEDRMLASQAAAGGCHVLAIDYRGFGDSTGWPTHWPSEESTSEDAMALWSWLESRVLVHVQEGEEERGEEEGAVSDVEECSGESTGREAGTTGSNSEWRRRQKRPSVFIYGHSLGCAISTQLASALSSRGSSVPAGLQPAGLVLVSPFTSAPEVARDYPYTAFLRLVPYATELM